MSNDIVANHGVERNLVIDADVPVVLDNISLIDHVVAIDIAPKTGTVVIVNLIFTERDADALGDLGSARLPVRVEAVDVVRPDAIALDEDMIAVAADADLSIVMNVAITHATACPDIDSSPAVQPGDAIFYCPSGALIRVDRAFLRWTPILLYREVADHHIGCVTLEGKCSDCRL